MTEPAPPNTPEWNSWATLANDVSEALQQLEPRPLFSERTRIARSLWEAGYRPSPEQVAAEVTRQRGRDADWLRPTKEST